MELTDLERAAKYQALAAMWHAMVESRFDMIANASGKYRDQFTAEAIIWQLIAAAEYKRAREAFMLADLELALK